MPGRWREGGQPLRAGGAQQVLLGPPWEVGTTCEKGQVEEWIQRRGKDLPKLSQSGCGARVPPTQPVTS